METSLHLLPPLGEDISLLGTKVPGAGWYGHTTGLHTVAIRVSNFRGRISVQAAIAADPGDADWYSVLPDAADYIQFPRRSYLMPPNNTGETSVTSFNFVTNAVWLRASVDRRYLLSQYSTPLDAMQYGTVNYIMVNYG